MFDVMNIDTYDTGAADRYHISSVETGPLQAQFPQLTNDPTFFRFFVPSLRTWIGCDLSICKS